MHFLPKTASLFILKNIIISNSDTVGNINQIQSLLKDLTGECRSYLLNRDSKTLKLLNGQDGIGYSQFNELMLLFGYRRVSPSFFQFLVDGTLEPRLGAKISSINHLSDAVANFQRVALLYFGSIKNAFKTMVKDDLELKYYILSTSILSIDKYRYRHLPIIPRHQIDPKDAHYLGYITQKKVRKRLEKNPNAEKNILEKEKLEKLSKIWDRKSGVIFSI